MFTLEVVRRWSLKYDLSLSLSFLAAKFPYLLQHYHTQAPSSFMCVHYIVEEWMPYMHISNVHIQSGHSSKHAKSIVLADGRIHRARAEDARRVERPLQRDRHVKVYRDLPQATPPTPKMTYSSSALPELSDETLAGIKYCVAHCGISSTIPVACTTLILPYLQLNVDVS